MSCHVFICLKPEHALLSVIWTWFFNSLMAPGYSLRLSSYHNPHQLERRLFILSNRAASKKMLLRSLITSNASRMYRRVVCQPTIRVVKPSLDQIPSRTQVTSTTTTTAQQLHQQHDVTAQQPVVSYQRMDVCTDRADWIPAADSLDVARGTPSDPIIVESVNEERLVGCVCDPDSSTIAWVMLKQGVVSQCSSCGNCFRLHRAFP